MKQKLRSFLMVLVPLTLVLCVSQTFLIQKLESSHIFYLSTWSIYVFHFIATLIVYTSVVYVNNVFSDKTGFAFMACGVLKMFATIVFLLPLILNSKETPASDVIAFFVPYFIYLLFETLFVVKLLVNKP
ncbi:DUF6168 family protein [uncultured Formosa sp.]|uniref:DUF6168 family protein n=1 Tax=uncultured Formosa sp. TaxID=255435 RepID=UPI00260BB22A|nr:DUF6168 family protein [uncultured Formosa sp.]